jgi:hypothetical protein
MTPGKRNGTLKVWAKWIGLLVSCLFIGSILSCGQGNGSTSSGSSSGTGTGWTISVIPSKNSASASSLETVQINALVRDRSGDPVPIGTQICFSASRGGFTAVSQSFVYNSACVSTTADNRQATEPYQPASPGSSPEAPISLGQDTITVSAMGVFGSTTIEVTP